MNPITQSFNLGDGRTITIETGKLAKQADGSAVVRMGNTMLLATIVSDHEAGENVDFLPLTVEYKEKYAAAGRFPGGFFKREARPSDYEILIARLIDRALRPLFPDDYHANTVVTVNLISLDPEIYPDQLACLAASAALAVSDIPFNDGPISEVRVGRINGQFQVNPPASTMSNADIDLIVAASEKNLVMVEGEMKEVSEKDMVEAIKFAHDAIRIQINALKELASKVEKAKVKRTYNHETHDEELKKNIWAFCYDKCRDVARMGLADKAKRSELFKAIKSEFVATLSPEFAADNSFLIGQYYHAVEKEAMRRVVLDDKIRLDGRRTDQIRPIWSEIDYLPSTHGSAVFTRGETQSLTTVTLGSKLDEQDIDGAVISGSQKFLLHYNFPAFSTGEARASRGTSRREVGHGNLAFRAIKPMIPATCPYTIRVVSDILESNGSSSMATVCAGSLALFDAGVQMASPVAGIAMGLITDDQGKYAVLSDILGDEDHLGDMDFKVAGTVNGITATQMDLKVNGLPYEVLEMAVEQARQGRLHILGEMAKTIAQPRTDYKPHAPRIEEIRFPSEFIGAVIGPGGKIIQEMQKVTGATISIDEVGQEGVAQVSGPNAETVNAALARIKAIVAQPEIGEVYDATVVSIQPYGAFVEFMPGKEGLLHISEISWKRLETLDGVVKPGDHVKVKLLDVDKKSGKFKLSRKVLLPKPERQENGDQGDSRERQHRRE